MRLCEVGAQKPDQCHQVHDHEDAFDPGFAGHGRLRPDIVQSITIRINMSDNEHRARSSPKNHMATTTTVSMSTKVKISKVNVLSMQETRISCISFVTADYANTKILSLT